MEHTRWSREQIAPPAGGVRPNAGDNGPALPHVGILSGLSSLSLSNLSAYGRYDDFPAGAEVIHEGALQERLYVVVEGLLSISANRGAQAVVIGEAHAGECLGETNLLEPGPAPSTLRVVKDAVLWSMDITDLRIYISDHAGGAGAFLMGIAACLAGRLRDANQRILKHHQLPVESLPKGRERAITASNTPIQPGFFDRLKKTVGAGGEKKIRISTKIKM